MVHGTSEGRCWPQILAISIGCLGAVNTGYQYAWTSPFILQLTQDKISYDITEDEASYLALITPLFMMLSCPLCSYLTKVIGPKKTYLLATIPYILHWILTVIARTASVFYIARIFTGVADALMYVAFPMYIGEISVPRIRGTFGAGPTICMCLGMFAMNLIGAYYDLRRAAYICIATPILFGLLFSWMPESPYHLIIKQREDDAKSSLRWLRGKTDVEEDFQQLKIDIKRQMSERGAWRDLVLVKSNRKAVIAGIFLRLSQQLSGLQPFEMYTKYIFEKSGSDISSDMSAILYMGLTFLLNLIAGSFSDYIGRKKSYMLSLGTTAVALWTLGGYLYLNEHRPDIDLGMFQWVPLACLIAATVFQSFGVAIIPNLMTGELFSSSIKDKGVTVLVYVMGFISVAVLYVFYNLTVTFGMFSAFIFLAASTTLSTILTPCVVPETKGLTLEEIQMSLSKKKLGNV